MEVCKLFKSKFVNQRVVEQTYRLFKQCTDEEKKMDENWRIYWFRLMGMHLVDYEKWPI